MSVAYDLDPVAPLSPRGLSPRALPTRSLCLVPAPAARPVRPAVVPTSPLPTAAPVPTAVPVSVLRPLHDPAPVRLTRRGVVVLGLALAAIGLAVVVFGALTARSAAAPPSAVGPAVVTVQAGDTLWSIASHSAPGVDPRAEIAIIDRLNSLHGESLVPGQRLRVR